jgi:hypothetical protein
MNTYSKSASEYYGHTREDGNGDFNESNSNE